MKRKNTIPSHMGFGIHWDELPQFAGYVPEQYGGNWNTLKQMFCSSGNYDQNRPLPVNIRKDNDCLVVKLYGFKIPDTPPVAAFGTDAAIKGRVALCETVQGKQKIAIAW